MSEDHSAATPSGPTPEQLWERQRLTEDAIEKAGGVVSVLSQAMGGGAVSWAEIKPALAVEFEKLGLDEKDVAKFGDYFVTSACVATPVMVAFAVPAAAVTSAMALAGAGAGAVYVVFWWGPRKGLKRWFGDKEMPEPPDPTEILKKLGK